MTELIGFAALRVLRQQDGLPHDWAGGSDLIRRTVHGLLVNIPARVEDEFWRHIHHCESPIKCIGLAALLTFFPTAALVKNKEDLKANPDWDFAIVPQMRLCSYRLDLGVLNRANRTAFDLECDGRHFHHDKRKDCARDIALWRHGVIAFHVSGSALCRNPYAALEPFSRKVRGY